MREGLKAVFLLVAALYLFSTVAPDPQDYLVSTGLLTFLDDDDLALCDGFAIAFEPHPLTGNLPHEQQAGSTPFPTSSTSPCRAPPSRVIPFP